MNTDETHTGRPPYRSQRKHKLPPCPNGKVFAFSMAFSMRSTVHFVVRIFGYHQRRQEIEEAEGDTILSRWSLRLFFCDALSRCARNQSTSSIKRAISFPSANAKHNQIGKRASIRAPKNWHNRKRASSGVVCVCVLCKNIVIFGVPHRITPEKLSFRTILIVDKKVAKPGCWN